jgi:hypothetical protein
MKEAVIKTVYRLGERDLQALTSCWISRARNNLREMNVRPPQIAHLSSTTRLNRIGTLSEGLLGVFVTRLPRRLLGLAVVAIPSNAATRSLLPS